VSRTELGASSRIIVTGASGFVGRKLTSRLASQWPEACVIPVHSRPGNAGSTSLDLADFEATLDLVEACQPTAIVHLAALSSVGATTNSAAEIWRSNVEGTRALATAALTLKHDVRFIFASSGEVYGTAFNNGPCREDSALAPASPYARTKAACEYLLADLSSAQFSVVALRLFNHSGVGQDDRFVVPSLAGQIARVEREGRDGQIEVGNLDACRDFTDVEDVIDAYLKVIRHDNLPSHFSVFNVGSGHTRSIQSVLEALIRHAIVDIEPVQSPSRMRPIEVRVAEGVFDRFRETYGWVPTRDFDNTIAQILDDQRVRLRERLQSA
jgi:GDP-4-dehydro-6-deoxy-D-mannose reductase